MKIHTVLTHLSDASGGSTLPKARTSEIIVQEVADETLVYDLKTHKAHSLNAEIGYIWRHCDGQHTIPEIAGLIKTKFGVSVDDEYVAIGLRELKKSELLETAPHGISRRKIMTQVLPAALAIPAILSLRAPAAAQAASCIPDGGACGVDADCCGGFCDEVCGGIPELTGDVESIEIKPLEEKGKVKGKSKR